MPTFSTIQLDTLLEPRTRISNLKQQQQIHHDSSINNQQDQADEEEDALKITNRRSPNHVFISPALYTTPQPTPILDSDTALSGSVSPSPYVFNRKGRGGGGFGGGARLASPSLSRPVNGFEIHEEQEEMQQQNICNSDEIGVVDDNFADEKCNVDEDFFDRRADSASSVADSVDLNDFGRDFNSLSLVSNQGDFFDADEEFFSDGSVSSVKTCGRSIESELRATRLRLFEEIEVLDIKASIMVYSSYPFSSRLELLKVARRQRVKRRGQRKWLFWSCLGISVVIGASVIAYSCLPQTSELPPMLLASSNDTDSSCITSSSESS